MAEPPHEDPKPPTRPQMEKGGTGTAKVSFKDALGADVKIVSSTWASGGPVTVTADDKDPSAATLEAIGHGRAAVHVTVQSESGATGTASTEVIVIETGSPADGKIEISVKPPAAAAAAPAAPAAA